MPEQHPRTRKIIYLLSSADAAMQLVRVKCDRCSRERHYRPNDLIKIFGDVDVNRLAWKMRCERCGSGEQIDAQATLPAAAQRAGIKARRLVEIKIYRRPVWRDE